MNEETTAVPPAVAEDKQEKRMKNLISLVILLAGLFVGSLFVDIVQLIQGSGFSQKNLSKSDVFETGGKTWVAYSEPLIDVKVVSDETCEKCDPSEALVWLRRVSPTIRAARVSFDSEDGKALIEKAGIKTLPAFIFAPEIVKTEFYAQAQVLFAQKVDQYVLNTQELGLEPGKYLNLPEVKDGDATFGKQESKVKVFVYSDFQCPYCQLFWTALRDTMKAYQDTAFFDYKHLALPIHPQAENAALAAECAQEQGKFWEYGDKLFEAQADWTGSTGTTKFKTYAAALGLNRNQFNQCLDDKKFQSKIDADKAEAESFGIAGTPATFINSQFKNGVVSKDDLKTAIDSELNK